MSLTNDFPRGHDAAPEKSAKLATAAWSTDAPLWREGMIWLGRRDDGAAIGNDDNRHMLTIAGSRAGKGTSAIVPNLCLWPGSCVVIDPKGENAGLTAETRSKRAGHTVVVLDPFGEADVPASLRTRFNPLELIDFAADDAIDVVAAIGDALTVGSDAGNDVHWTESARQIIEAVILHVAANRYEKDRSLVRVRQLLTLGDVGAAERFTELARDRASIEAHAKAIAKGKTEAEADQEAAIAAAEVKDVSPFTALWSSMSSNKAENEAVRDVIAGAANSIREMGDNERGSILSTARRNTKFLDSPRMRACVSGEGLSIDRLKTDAGGLSLYVCLPARFLPTHARFLRLVLNLTLYRMEALGLAPSTGRPVLFILDEFAALGRLEVIEKAAGLMAGYGVKLWPILQDLGQIKRHYRESWETFVGNAGVLQFFGNTDLTTLEWISKRMGQIEVSRETIGRSTATTTGRTKSQGQTVSEGWSLSSGTAEGRSAMADLQRIATRDGGASLGAYIARVGASEVSHSQNFSKQDGITGGTSTQRGDGSSSGTSETESSSEAIHLAALMSLDEIARFFDRDTGLQIIFRGGKAPVALRRTPYMIDDQFTGRYRSTAEQARRS